MGSRHGVRRGLARPLLVGVLLLAASPVARSQGAGLDTATARPQAREESALSDAGIWDDFARWVEGLPRRPPGESASLRDLYVKHVTRSGLSIEEARRRLARIDILRGESLRRERIYWNGKHKLGDGPAAPLALVREAVRGVPPGRALDVAMGNGRHSMYLASLGWSVTGYDFSPESVRGALAAAANAGVTITAVEATHDTFDLGRNQWDLIVLSYPYTDAMDPQWPPRLSQALAPGGIVVFQNSVPLGRKPADVADLWKSLHLIRLELIDHGEDWLEGQELQTVKIIARRQ